MKSSIPHPPLLARRYAAICSPAGEASRHEGVYENEALSSPTSDDVSDGVSAAAHCQSGRRRRAPVIEKYLPPKASQLGLVGVRRFLGGRFLLISRKWLSWYLGVGGQPANVNCSRISNANSTRSTWSSENVYRCSAGRPEASNIAIMHMTTV